jgi:hypothetical protein
MRLPTLLQLKPRERLLALGSGVVLSMLLLDRLVLHPWLRHAQTIRAETRRLEDTLQTHYRLMEREEGVLADVARHQRYLQPAVADDLEMAALLKELDELARQGHVLVGEIKPLATETVESAKRYALEVRFQCTMEEWLGFVHAIERSPSLYEIVRAGLGRQEEAQDRLEGYLRLESAAILAQTPSPPAEPGASDG